MQTSTVILVLACLASAFAVQYQSHPKSFASRAANISGPTSTCQCNFKKIWIDVVFVLDSSNAIQSDGLSQGIAFIQSSLANLNRDPTVDSFFYSRSAVISYAKTAKTVIPFGKYLQVEDLFDPANPLNSITLSGGMETNLTAAADAAIDILNKATSRGARQVIVVIASAFNPKDELKVLEQFKTDKNVLIVVDYVQPGQEIDNLLLNISSVGFNFVNNVKAGTALTFNDINTAFCDANCFCPKGLTPYPAQNKYGRETAGGGCYNPVNLAAIQPAASNACKKQKAILATVHDAPKQTFLTSLQSSSATYWLGYKRSAGTYTWDDGSSSTYTKFCNGTPQSSDGDCVYATGTGSKCWNPAQCYSEAFFYICQAQACDSTYNCLSN